MEVKCTECETNTFKFNPLTVRIKMVDIVYVECDCGARYLSHVKDKEIHERLEKQSD